MKRDKTVMVHCMGAPVSAVRSEISTISSVDVNDEHFWTGNSKQSGACAIQRAGMDAVMKNPNHFGFPVLGIEVKETTARFIWKIGKDGRHYARVARHNGVGLIEEFDGLVALSRPERAERMRKRFGSSVTVTFRPPFADNRKRVRPSAAASNKKRSAKKRGFQGRLLTVRQHEADIEKELYERQKRGVG